MSKELYQNFKETYEVYMNQGKDAENYKDRVWEILKYGIFVLALVLMIVAVVLSIKNEIKWEICFFAFSMLLLLFVTKHDQKVYSEVYKKNEDRRMQCVEKTICAIVEAKKLDLETLQCFLEMMDESAKKKMGYRIPLWIVSLACAVIEYFVFVSVSVFSFDGNIWGLTILGVLFIVQKLVTSNTLKEYTIGEPYYLSLVKRYYDVRKKQLV